MAVVERSYTQSSALIVKDSVNEDISAAQAGDKEAFARLLRRYEQSLSYYLQRFTDNEAVLQDLRQETYLELYRSLSSYRHEGAFPRWLRQIASRVGYRHWAVRAKDTRAKTAFLELQRGIAATLPAAQQCTSVDSVEVLLSRLGRYDKTLLEMRYLQGLTAIEIAERLGCNAGGIRVRLHRVCKRLRSRQGFQCGRDEQD